jgi:hypothetical protein
MTTTGSSCSQESSGSRRFDFDALYRGESPGEGIAPVATPPWDNKARATRPCATLLLSCFSDANPAGEDWRPAVSEETLREVLGGAGWDVESLEPATLSGELDGAPVEMAFWYLRAQRR